MSRSYDKAFKLNALALFKDGRKGNQVCRDLGIPESTFWGWVEEYRAHGEAGFPGSGYTREVDKDLAALQKELADVRLERDILKKALAIFSRQN